MAAHPQQHPLLALALAGLCSGSVPFGVGLSHMTSDAGLILDLSLPHIGLAKSPHGVETLFHPIFVVDCFVFFQLFWQQL